MGKGRTSRRAARVLLVAPVAALAAVPVPDAPAVAGEPSGLRCPA